MLVKKYQDMLSTKSIIRMMSTAAIERGKTVGYENVFDFTIGNPSVPTPPEFTKVMIELLEQRNPMELHGYSPNMGILSVRQAVADSLHQRFGVPYEAKNIFMVSGATSALVHAIRCVVAPGDEVLTFAPFFPEYHPYVEGAGAVLKIVPPQFDTFQINFEEFLARLNEKTTAVLINTPNNPSGIVYSEETIKKLTDILKEKQKEYGHDIYIISDEPYREILFDGVSCPCISRFYDNAIMCYSFSKSISLPGERIGYVAVNPAIPQAEVMVNMFVQISRQLGHNCPASIIQLAVAEVLDKTSDISIYEANMNLLYDCLINLGFTVVKPSGTFYIFPKALEEDATAFCNKALKYNVVLVPGDNFGAPGYFRLSYCVDTEKVQRSLKAIEEFVKAEYGISHA